MQYLSSETLPWPPLGWQHTIWQTVTRCCAIKSQTSLRTQISLDLLIIWTNTYAATSQATFSTCDSCHNIHMPPHCLLADDDILTHYTSGHSVTAVFKCTSMLSFFTAEIWHTFHFGCSVPTLLRHLYKCLCTANTNLNKLVIPSCQNNMRLATSKNRLNQIKSHMNILLYWWLSNYHCRGRNHRKLAQRKVFTASNLTKFSG